MKKFVLIILAASLGSTALLGADTFLIKFSGVITTPTGRTRVKETDLVRTNGNVLVAVVDTNQVSEQFLRIWEADSTGTNLLRANIESYGKALDASGRRLTVDLFAGFLGGFDPNVGNILPNSHGEILGQGLITPSVHAPKSIRLSFSGVWNSASNAVFKGTMTGKLIP